MLVKYKKTLEKIAMGLLSYMPQDKDVKKLKETVQQYEKDEQWQLYLWRNEDEYVGAIGVILKDDAAHVQHITVLPSYRGEGVARQMLEELKAQMQVDDILPCQQTEAFVQKCKNLLEEASC